jgi:hypothetical protein
MATRHAQPGRKAWNPAAMFHVEHRPGLYGFPRPFAALSLAAANPPKPPSAKRDRWRTASARGTSLELVPSGRLSLRLSRQPQRTVE